MRSRCANGPSTCAATDKALCAACCESSVWDQFLCSWPPHSRRAFGDCLQLSIKWYLTCFTSLLGVHQHAIESLLPQQQGGRAASLSLLQAENVAEAVGPLVIREGRVAASAVQLFSVALSAVDNVQTLFVLDYGRGKIVTGLLNRLRTSRGDPRLAESLSNCLSELCRGRLFRVRFT